MSGNEEKGYSQSFHLRMWLPLALPFFFLPKIFGQYAFEQRSEPPGLFSTTTQTLEVNASVSTQTPNPLANGHAFTHWTINGVRKDDSNGQALTRINLNLTSNVLAIAHYLDEEFDGDGDGTPDWYEIHLMGTLDHNGSYDGDADGYGLAQERKYGLVSTIKDEISEGGVSVRRSGLVFLNLGGAKRLTVSSDPPGLVPSSITYPETNSSYTSSSLSGISNGYVFSHWEINGVRKADEKGVALSQISETLDQDKTLVAKYYAENEDIDGDQVPDWYEWREFGNLNNDGANDPDGDGFTLGQERQYGLSAVIDNNVSEGGISVRRSGLTFLNLGGAKELVVRSDPAGLVSSATTYPETNSLFTSESLHGLVNGFVFSHWEVNGVRKSDGLGLGLSRISETLDQDKILVAKYYAENEDIDGDQVPDWFEWREFGNLNNDGANDPDGDGFTLAQERQYGLSAVIDDNVSEGGISIRRSAHLSYSDAAFDANGSQDSDGDGLSNATEVALGIDPDQPDTDGDGYPDGVEVSYGSDPNDPSSLGNYPPDSLAIIGSSILENQPIGTQIGEFNATDPDADSTLVFSLVDGNGSLGNPFFNLDENGSLSSAVIFDYENNASNYSIRVKVTDEHNASLEKAFTISLLNEIEDLDGDGVEDFYDADDDNDGFSDVAEITYGSNPRDAGSVANAAPSSLDLNGSGIQENQPIGSVVGLLKGIDPDANASLSYSLVDGNGSIDNPLFSLDANGSLSSAVIFDFENNASNYSIRVRVTDEHNASLEKAFTISLLNEIEDLDGDGIEDFYDADDDNDGFSDAEEIIYGSDPRDAHSVANATPSDLDLNGSTILENQPAGTLVGLIIGTDPDANASLSYSLVDGNGSIDNPLFSLDENGTLSSAVIFDYETNASNYSIRVKVTDEQNASLEKPFVISLLNEIEDLDGDGIEDFYDADDDNDGFSDAEEIAYGSDPRDADSVANAAPSSLDLNGSAILENQPIDALVGLLQGIDPDANASLSYSLVDGNGSMDNSLFILDGNGTLSSAVIFDYETNASNYSIRVKVTDEQNASLEKPFVISLLNEIEDLDGDGIEDFYDADDDNDGFSDAEEIAYGSDPRDAGSVANAAPSSLDLNGSGILENKPIGTIIGLTEGIDPDANASLSYSLVDGNGSMDNSLFILDGNGTLSSAVVFDFETNASNYSVRVRVTDEHNASLEKIFIISLLNEIEDLDGDGIEDFYDADDDNDGFSDAEEIAYGSDPRDAGSVANAAPSSLDLNGSGILENKPIGTIIGLTEGIDPDANASLSYSLVDGNGSMDNSLFILDGNGTLSSAVVFDFETNASNYSVRVRVTDEHNASLEKIFIISLLNEIEDLDGDGIEDFYDADDDNDGFSDAEEIAYGSDPRDAGSVANAAPSSLDLNGSGILENKPIGTIIGLTEGIDPDANASLSYSLVDGNGSMDNSLFILDGNGTLSSAVVFDFETNASNYSVRVRVTDEHNASLEKIFIISLLNEIEDLDGDGIEDFYDSDDDNDGFSDVAEIAYGSDPRDAHSLANAAPASLDLNGTDILENQTAGTLIGLIDGIDPNTNAILSYSLVDGNGSKDNPFFSLDGNGTLSSKVIFDYEQNASHYSIRVRVTDEHNVSLEKAFVISLLNVIEDLDGDGVEDFYDFDDDNDGFSDAEESVYGSNPRDAHSMANAAPASLDLNDSGILENKPIGTIIGLTEGIDPDANASLSYSLVDGNGSQGNALFILDANGSLSSAMVFDFENNQSDLSIRVRVTDEHNASLEKTFIISLLNEIEDLDGDGVEDFYDTDDDNDGFSDAEESVFGSDPRDADSVANAAPSSLDLNGSGIMENQPIGAVVGLLQGSDPDAIATLSYSLVDGTGSKDNPLFSLDENGTLSSSVTFEYENNQSELSIRVRVTDEHNASLETVFTIRVLDGPSDYLLPWVRGLNLHFDENGSRTLSFEAGTEDGAELLETGILLSFAGDEQRFAADLNGSGDPYLVSLDGLKAGRTYYYQAYARSQVGETLSAIGKMSIGYDSSLWWGETAPDGWVRDSWMGSFLPTESGWLFHSRLGWIYAEDDEMGGLWIWSREESWLWSRADLFPFLYSNDTGNWLYLLPSRSEVLFYDYAIGSLR